MKKCPNCYAHLPNDLENCPMCGTSVKDAESLPDDPASASAEASADISGGEKRFCPFCGKELQTAGATFCPFCGKALSGKPNPSTPPPSYHYTPPPAQAPVRKICPKCGVAYHNRDTCPDCHVRLLDSDQSHSSISYKSLPEYDYASPDANGCLVVIAFLIPIIGFIIALVSYNNDNRKAGKSYLKAAIAGIIVNVVLLMILAACGAFSGPTYYY